MTISPDLTLSECLTLLSSNILFTCSKKKKTCFCHLLLSLDSKVTKQVRKSQVFCIGLIFKCQRNELKNTGKKFPKKVYRKKLNVSGLSILQCPLSLHAMLSFQGLLATLLYYLYYNNLELCKGILENAVKKITFRVYNKKMKMLAENKLAWKTQAFANAAVCGGLRIMKWFRANGCPWDTYAFSEAVVKRNVVVLNWLKRKNVLGINLYFLLQI